MQIAAYETGDQSRGPSNSVGHGSLCPLPICTDATAPTMTMKWNKLDLVSSDPPPLTALRQSGTVLISVLSFWAGSGFVGAVSWTVYHTSSITCRYVSGYDIGAELCRLVTEAYRSEQFAQDYCAAKNRTGDLSTATPTPYHSAMHQAATTRVTIPAERRRTVRRRRTEWRRPRARYYGTASRRCSAPPGAVSK